MIIRFKLELTNKSPERWELWKELESLLTEYCIKHGVGEFDITYDEAEMVKNCTLSFDSDSQFRKLTTDAGILAGQNDLEIALVSQETLHDPVCNLIDQHKHKYKKEGNEIETIS